LLRDKSCYQPFPPNEIFLSPIDLRTEVLALDNRVAPTKDEAIDRGKQRVLNDIMATQITTHGGFGTSNYRAYALTALLVIYVFEVIDRILLSLVQEQVRAELSLSDLQLGLLGGPAFVVLYVLSTVPIARLAESRNRITIVASGAAVWSVATAACGFAGTFIHLLIARMFVGIGEAACVPPSHSAISDYYPSDKRASALAIFGLSMPIGILLAAFGGGWLAQRFDWRTMFMMLGGLGVVAALILKLTVKDPGRSSEHTETPSLGATLKSLGSKRSYWHAIAGGCLIALFGAAMTNFFVSYTMREYQLDIGQATFGFGILYGFGVAGGIFGGGYLIDKLQYRYPRVIAWLPAGGLLMAVPFYLVAFFQTSYVWACVFFFAALVCHFLHNAPMFAVAQQVAEPRMRATSSAIVMLALTLVGYGLGPPLVGAIADHVSAQLAADAGLTLQLCAANPTMAKCADVGGAGLRAGLIVALMFAIWGAVHFWLVGRSYISDRFEKLA
jgi:predicted MFS family arabinose efflux permease